MDGWNHECGAGIAAHPHDLACALRRGHARPHQGEGRSWTDEEASALDGRLRRALDDAQTTARAVVLGTMSPKAAAFRLGGAGGVNRREQRQLANRARRR